MKKVFSIRDVKVSAFSNPILEENEIQAVRNLSVALENDQTMLSKYPADYELFHVADYDEIQGKFINLEYPKFIISCQSVMLNMLKARELQKKLKDSALEDKQESN